MCFPLKIVTRNKNGTPIQTITYTFDSVGNVEAYENRADGHTTRQDYTYDGLYQLTEARGQTRSHPFGQAGSTEYTAAYRQIFAFDRIGNMTGKTSTSSANTPNRLGDSLNYTFRYDYISGTRKAERIGNRYYSYDLNGNLIAERDGSPAVNPEVYIPYYQDGDLYWTEYGFGLVRPGGQRPNDGVYQRNYRWNERNLLSESSDSAYTVQYRYGADGQRALKYVVNSNTSTMYFNKMWHVNNIRAENVQSKHIFVGETRIATKINSADNNNTATERVRTYYYHSDHLGSAQTVTNWQGNIHERLEYTPYGETWIDWRNTGESSDKTPFRFTAKERDEETGLYYFGARYLDARTSRWLSVDPALGEFIPQAGGENNLPNGGLYNHFNFHVYNYSNNNPVMYVDPDGEAPTFWQNEHGVWSFLLDNKIISTGVSFVDIFIPFFSTGYYLGTDTIASNIGDGSYKTVSRHIISNAFGELSSYLGLYSEVVRGTNFSYIAGNTSRIISGINFIAELSGNASYINQIVGDRYGSRFSSKSFNETLNGFILYSALVKDLVDYGAITYKKNWFGEISTYNVNRELYDRYFHEQGITPTEYYQWIRDTARQSNESTY